MLVWSIRVFKLVVTHSCSQNDNGKFKCYYHNSNYMRRDQLINFGQKSKTPRFCHIYYPLQRTYLPFFCDHLNFLSKHPFQPPVFSEFFLFSHAFSVFHILEVIKHTNSLTVIKKFKINSNITVHVSDC